ncbi:MAG: low molecular weight protein-tyrosine-phosphatase [Bacteroidales bacterium]|nr:low molecular weight protein-tyrosine-phosphatase [Bacteroidales bacterium]
MSNSKEKTRILFVCLGNICRSPSAEAIFKAIAEKAKIPVEVDSAGTSAWHEGEMADNRMRRTAAARGYKLTSISRALKRKDFDEFDMIIAMDDKNYHDIKDLAQSAEEEEKVFRMRDFFVHKQYDHIPDPYYGGEQGFNMVIDLLEDASEGLVAYLKKRKSS